MLLLNASGTRAIVAVIRRSSNEPIHGHLQIVHERARLIELDTVSRTCIIAKSLVRGMVIDIARVYNKERLFPRSIFGRAFLTINLQEIGLLWYHKIISRVDYRSTISRPRYLIGSTVNGGRFVAVCRVIRAVLIRVMDIIKSRHSDFLLPRPLHTARGNAEGHLFLVEVRLLQT